LETEERESQSRRIARRVIIFLLSLAVILVVWYYYSINTNPIIFATPQAVLSALISLFTKHDMSGAVLGMLWVLFLGLGLSVLVGIPTGLAMGKIKIVNDVLDPYMTAFYVVPRVAMVPLFIIWFGFALTTSILFVYTFSFFPIILIVAQGVKNTSRIYIDVARVGCANERQIFTKVIIPSAMPYIFAALRIGLVLAYIGVIIAQLDLVVTGVGHLLLSAQETYSTDQLLAILIVLAIVGFVLSEFMKLLEKRLTHGLSYSTIGGL
jgi:ABC-type nitrate/sulfonate/bicarbonate transport system permease component